jgi:hypothetical protein
MEAGGGVHLLARGDTKVLVNAITWTRRIEVDVLIANAFAGRIRQSAAIEGASFRALQASSARPGGYSLVAAPSPDFLYVTDAFSSPTLPPSSLFRRGVTQIPAKAPARERPKGTAMTRDHQPGQSVFASILTEDIAWKPFQASPTVLLSSAIPPNPVFFTR